MTQHPNNCPAKTGHELSEEMFKRWFRELGTRERAAIVRRDEIWLASPEWWATDPSYATRASGLPELEAEWCALHDHYATWALKGIPERITYFANKAEETIEAHKRALLPGTIDFALCLDDTPCTQSDS